MKKFLIVPVMMCLLVVPFLLVACGHPSDRPYIKSKGKDVWNGASFSKTITLVNPTDKTFTVTLYGNYSFRQVKQTGRWTTNYPYGGSDEQSTEIGPNETKEYKVTYSFPEDATNMKYRFKGILISREKTE
jgi:hypothetical protein